MKRLADLGAAVQLCLPSAWLAMILAQILIPFMPLRNEVFLFAALGLSLTLLLNEHQKLNAGKIPAVILVLSLIAALTCSPEFQIASAAVFFFLILGQCTLTLYWQQNPELSLGVQLAVLCLLALVTLLLENPVRDAVTRGTFMLMISALLLRIENHLRIKDQQAALVMNNSGRDWLVAGLSLLQLLLILVNSGVDWVIRRFTDALLAVISGLFTLFVRLFAFLFSAVILILQKIVEWFIAHGSLSSSEPPPSASGELQSGMEESVTQLAEWIQPAALILLILAAGFILFLLIRLIVRLSRQSRPKTKDSGFQSVSTFQPRSILDTLKVQIHDLLHPETLSPVRRKYKEAVQERIRHGQLYQSSQTPNEYLEQCRSNETDDTFEKLTRDYNKDRYQP